MEQESHRADDAEAAEDRMGNPGFRLGKDGEPPLPRNLDQSVERLDALLENTQDPERLRMGMGIRLAMGMAQELKQGVALGSRTGDMVAEWVKEHGQEAVDRAVQVAREFLLKPDELRKALAKRLNAEPEASED